jgi:MoxR-like ATPase
MPMHAEDDQNQARLAELFKQGPDGLRASDLLAVLPRPWDATPEPDPSQPGEGGKPPPYDVDRELGAAAWVSLLLRQPLLLTGDPGVGKTRFAEKLAFDLGVERPTLVQVKSTTSGRDLLYKFDDLMRFRDATLAGALGRLTEQKGKGKKGDRESTVDTDATGVIQRAKRPLVSYVRMEGLGRAILRAAGAQFRIKTDPDLDKVEAFGEEKAAKSELTLWDIFPKEFPDAWSPPRYTVVLIDELDKAPRDTPNDLLGEIERMTFRFDELGFSVTAEPKYKPIVIITSNSERNLPDAFLRRCVYHNIETPGRERMCKIAAARLGGIDPDSGLMKEAWKGVVNEAWDVFDKVATSITEKKPGTAEFIALVAYLRATDDGRPLSEGRLNGALRIFNKTKADLASADLTAGAAVVGPDVAAAEPP